MMPSPFWRSSISMGISVSRCWIRRNGHTNAHRNLWGVRGDNVQIGDVVSFFERWDSVDVQHDAGDRGARLRDDLAEVVSDGSELHARGHIGAALDQRVPNPRAISDHVGEFFDPHRIFDQMRFAWKHFESTHGAER